MLPIDLYMRRVYNVMYTLMLVRKQSTSPSGKNTIDSRGFLASVAKADRGALSVSEFNKLKMRAETGIDTKFTMMENYSSVQ